MKTVQVKRLKDLERENSHLKKAVAELTVDKLILKGSFGGKTIKPRQTQALRGACEGETSYFRTACLSGDKSTPVNPETFHCSQV